MNRLTVLIGFTVFFSHCLTAQVTSSTLTGRILSSKKEPVIGAVITTMHEPTGTVFKALTDEDGYYHLENMIVGGPYSVKINSIGYKNSSKDNVFLSLGKTGKVDAELEEATTELATIEVKISKNDVFDTRKTGTG